MYASYVQAMINKTRRFMYELLLLLAEAARPRTTSTLDEFPDDLELDFIEITVNDEDRV